ncbi:MAG: transcription elongation factor GreA [Acidimicrobiia bacterium]|nr:transcription elongation factor GreA [Acidimicrobiia bacterium]
MNTDQPETKLSAAAHQRLTDELQERTTTRRRDISEWIERARELGDLRENADYDAAKNEQGHNEARIRHLESILEGAVIVEGAAGDVVGSGVVVSLLMEGDDEPIEYLVGSIEEKNTGYDVLSVNSPLGQALAGKAAGDKADYEAPGGVFTVTIVSIRPV